MESCLVRRQEPVTPKDDRIAEQSLAADGAIACFSNSFLRHGVNADRGPQLKVAVRWLIMSDRSHRAERFRSQSGRS